MNYLRTVNKVMLPEILELTFRPQELRKEHSEGFLFVLLVLFFCFCMEQPVLSNALSL